MTRATHVRPQNTSIILLFLTLGILIFTLITTFHESRRAAFAASKNDWIAGNIIDDNTFTDTNSMSTDDIQNFLDKSIGTCDIQGSSRASEYGSNLTRAQYASSRNWPGPPYTCLNKYYEIPKTTPGADLPISNYSNPSSIPTGAQSAAWIIKDAAVRYSINPKVLLVKIATESAGPLTSDNWPLFSQYRYAMGSHCPDSGPNGTANCDVNYAGFSIQMYSAAQLLRWYLDSMDQPWWAYKKPGNNFVLWNVQNNSNCGGSTINIENKATAALYTYTPYQPNDAALNNMYGNGDQCSAYGNRNFWRVFWDTFGRTRPNPITVDIKKSNVTLSDGTYRLTVSSGKSLDINQALTANGTRVQIWDSNTIGAQYWKVTNTNDGFYTLQNPLSGKFLDVEGGGIANGTRVQIWDGADICGQKWAITTNEGGYQLLSACSGRALDVSGNYVGENGTKVQVWDRNSLDAQRWKFSVVEP